MFSITKVIKDNYKENPSRFWWGTFMIFLGVAFLLDEYILKYLGKYFSWPMILIIIGIFIVLNKEKKE